MVNRKIITVPNPLLNEKSKPVKISPTVVKLVEEMKATLLSNEGTIGVGLAAVQIGIPQKIFLAYSEKSRRLLTFINAEIIWSSKTTNKGLPQKSNRYEGCLSIPNVWAIISRSKTIKIRYQSESGHWQIRKFTGMTASIIQHEYDHTQGILFTQRALMQDQKLYTLETDGEGESRLREIKL